jgi:hypothetical protein
MDKEQQFWIAFWGIMGTFIFALASVVTVSIYATNAMEYEGMAKMVQAGATPKEAWCAYRKSSYDTHDAYCMSQ